jgi:hypothetical protein
MAAARTTIAGNKGGGSRAGGRPGRGSEQSVFTGYQGVRLTGLGGGRRRGWGGAGGVRGLGSDGGGGDAAAVELTMGVLVGP